jgi:hypothetical protein
MSSPGGKRDRGRDDEAAREAALEAEFDRERQRQRAMQADRERQQEREYQRRLDVWERHERLVVPGTVQRVSCLACRVEPVQLCIFCSGGHVWMCKQSVWHAAVVSR